MSGEGVGRRPRSREERRKMSEGRVIVAKGYVPEEPSEREMEPDLALAIGTCSSSEDMEECLTFEEMLPDL